MWGGGMALRCQRVRAGRMDVVGGGGGVRDPGQRVRSGAHVQVRPRAGDVGSDLPRRGGWGGGCVPPDPRRRGASLAGDGPTQVSLGGRAHRPPPLNPRGGGGATTTGPDAPPPPICQNLPGAGAGGGGGGGGGRREGGGIGRRGGGGLAAWPGGGGGLRATHYYHMHTSRGCLGAWGYRGMHAIIAISCLRQEESLKGLKD